MTPKHALKLLALLAVPLIPLLAAGPTAAVRASTRPLLASATGASPTLVAASANRIADQANCPAPLPSTPFAGKWTILDNNQATKAIVASDARDATVSTRTLLYQLRKDGSVYQYVGSDPPSAGGVHPSPNDWKFLDGNPATAEIVASLDNIYQRHSDDGSIWKYIGGVHPNDWTRLDNPGDSHRADSFVADGDNVYEYLSDGTAWQLNTAGITQWGAPLPWQQIQKYSFTVQLAAGGGKVYRRNIDGTIWQYTGDPDNWQELNPNSYTSATTNIVAAGDQLYQLRSDGSIWWYEGTPDKWYQKDNNPATVQVAAAKFEGLYDSLYQLHNDGTIWEYTAGAGDGPPWLKIDDNPRAIQIAAAQNDVWELHCSGEIWMHNKTCADPMASVLNCTPVTHRGDLGAQ